MADLAYVDRKEQGLCTSRGCDRAASEESTLCEMHHRTHKRADRAYRQQQREERRAAGLCLWCPVRKPGGPNKAIPGSTACLVHQVARLRPPKSPVEGVDRVVDSKRARLASMTRKDAGNRTRYHGQGKRGMQPRIQLDGQDLEYARRAITAGEAGLKAFESDEAKAMPRIQREDVKHAALHHLQRAQGHIEDVLERRGHFKVRHGRRDGE